MTLNELFTNIANAIREKTESSDKIVASDFPTAISNIQTSTGLPQLVAVMYGTDAGNTSGYSGKSWQIFDTTYFSGGSSDLKQIVCQKTGKYKLHALMRVPNGTWAVVRKNAGNWYSEGTNLLGSGRVYTENFNSSITVTLNKGDYLATGYQLASDHANAGGCCLVYLAE